MLSWIGWVATAVFASSYLCREPATLRRVQAGAAVVWVAYGLLIHAAPVVAANLIVASVALVSSWPGRRAGAVSGKRCARSESHPERSEGGILRVMPPSLRSG